MAMAGSEGVSLSRSSQDRPASPIIVIEAGKTEGQYYRDLWRYRDLFFFLMWRDILVRYKQTALGVLWAVLRPLLTMLTFTFVFGRLARLPSSGTPYPLLVLSGLALWQFFSGAVSDASASLIGNSNLLSKVYFPRIMIPASAVAVSLVDFLISAALLAILMLLYGLGPSWRLLLIPPLVLITMAAATGAGLWLSALNVKYRDFRYVVPFMVQFGLYLSPVGFSSAAVTMMFSNRWRALYSLNPMAGMIDGFRWALFGQRAALYPPAILFSLLIAGVLLLSGVWYFRRAERTFADVI